MSRNGDTLSLAAPGKINLYLEVQGRRRNGYHDIVSLLVPISLYDRLELEATDGEVRLALDAAELSSGDDLLFMDQADNLAYRAALLLRERTGHDGGVRIKLVKRIPVGGGLGGGSADAAAVLVGLNALWRTGLSRAELMELGEHLGCDVPAMVHGGAVRMEGLGEKITPVACSAGWAAEPLWLTVVNPGFGVSTADIYSRHGRALTSAPQTFRVLVSAFAEGDTRMVGRHLRNDLQVTAFRKYPLLGLLAEALSEAGSPGVLLSGSGASLFGLAESREHAETMGRRISDSLGVPLWSAAVRMLPDSVMVAHGPLEA